MDLPKISDEELDRLIAEREAALAQRPQPQQESDDEIVSSLEDVVWDQSCPFRAKGMRNRLALS